MTPVRTHDSTLTPDISTASATCVSTSSFFESARPKWSFHPTAFGTSSKMHLVRRLMKSTIANSRQSIDLLETSCGLKGSLAQ